MGAQLSKGGVAVEGTADPAAAKANGQVSKDQWGATWHPTPTASVWVPRRGSGQRWELSCCSFILKPPHKHMAVENVPKMN